MLLKRHIISVCWLIVCTSRVLTMGAEVFNPSFRSDGAITEEESISNGKEFTHKRSVTYHFRLYFEMNGRWRLHSLSTNNIADQTFVNDLHMAFDGRDIYTVHYDPQILLFGDGGAISTTNSIDSFPAQIYPGGVPFNAVRALRLVWFAFFGALYLADKPKSMDGYNPLVVDPRRDASSFLWNMESTLVQSSSHLLIETAAFSKRPAPSKFDLNLFSEVFDPETLDDLDELQEKYRLHNESSSLGGSYRLVEYSNFGGVKLPRKFVGELPVPSVDRSKVSIKAAYTGIVTNLELGQVTLPMLPPIKGKLNVEDQRVRAREAMRWRRSVVYQLPGPQWITESSNPVIRKAVDAKPWKRTQLTHHRNEKYKALTGMLLFLLGLPFVLLFIQLCRKSTKNF